jgi:hypothetical protein
LMMMTNKSVEFICLAPVAHPSRGLSRKLQALDRTDGGNMCFQYGMDRDSVQRQLFAIRLLETSRRRRCRVLFRMIMLALYGDARTLR